jgi:large subunit ribosomal protein L5
MDLFYHSYLKDIVEYDLVTKFFYTKIKDIPVFKKVVLCFDYKNPSYKQILNSILALNIIGNQSNVILLTLKKSNVVLKLRSGSPVGCKIILRKLKMLEFLSNLFLIMIPQDKNYKGLVINSNIKNIISFNFKSLSLFNAFRDQYVLIKDLSSLSVTVTTNSKNLSEFIFILKSLKFKII